MRRLTLGSLFSGIAGLELGLSWALDCETRWQVEIDPFCRSVLARHYPHAIRYEDIHEVGRGRRYVPEHTDLLVGGFPCFPAGTLIQTERGLERIETISVGTRVFTHRGRYRPVTHTMRREGAVLVEVKARGAPALRATPEHPFWARKQELVWDNLSRRYKPRWLEPAWVEAKELTPAHYLAQPLQVEEPTPRVWHPHQFWYLVGRWLGDGWIVNHKRTSSVHAGTRGSRVNSRVWKAIICCAHHEAELLGARIRDAGFHATKAPDRTATKFHISSKALVEELAPFGSGAGGKHLPAWMFEAPREVLQALWEGYMASDGHRYVNGHESATTISECLALDMARVGRIITGAPVGVSRKTVPSTTRIEGRMVSQRPQYAVVTTSTQRAQRSVSIADGFCWVPVRRVTGVSEPTQVFNLAVEEDESYVAGSYVVHNCQPHSTAGRREGTSDARWLWPEFARLIDELSPRVVVAENVRGLLTVNGGAAFRQILEDLARLGYDAKWFLVRASDTGAPHKRERVFILAWKAPLGDTSRGALGDGDLQLAREPVEARGEGDARGAGAAVGHPLGGTAQPDGGAGEFPGAADAGPDGDGQPEHGDAPHGPGPRRGPGDLADAHGGGCPEGRDRLVPRRAEPDPGGGGERGLGSSGGTDDREPEPRLGVRADGLRPWVDGPGPGWPSRPGEPQHAWEAPRVAAEVPNRAARLRALGNAVVPQVAYLVGLEVRKILGLPALAPGEGFPHREQVPAQAPEQPAPASPERDLEPVWPGEQDDILEVWRVDTFELRCANPLCGSASGSVTYRPNHTILTCDCGITTVMPPDPETYPAPSVQGA